mmetsp:Transcript_19239/g.41707  ORF Transcript_19239/g.41707 Transcript_19239/m.41707 type:complete len:275 (+) Transcript_19239:2-826(+)
MYNIMSSEGCREIEAVEQRLAAAKAQESSASEMMDSANDMLATARKNMESSRNEVKATEALLKDAEKRWEVIDVDASAVGSPTNDSRYKRRKVSLSPDGVIEARGTSARALVGTTTSQTSSSATNSNDIGSGTNRRRAVGVTTSATTNQSNIDNNGSTVVEQMVIEGCGLTEVNGTFQRVEGATCNDLPMYSKKGQWEGSTVDFVMCCYLLGLWYIGIWPIGMPMDECGIFSDSLYRSPCNDDGSGIPPENGWMVWCDGVGPAPKCRSDCAIKN